MKTLYVADLDGTLFNSQKKVSEFTADTLNKCLEAGMNFTVATARMPYGCDTRLEALNLNLPGILTNGVFLYEFSCKRFVAVEPLPAASVKPVVEAFRTHGVSPFLYRYAEGRICIEYERAEMKQQTQYYSDRALESATVSLVQDVLGSSTTADVFYAACTGTEELLLPASRAVGGIPGVSCALYLNIYNGLYCLEAFSSNASKRNALAKLKTLFSYDELVVFGDNHNDVSMFEIADRCYAPENALPEIRKLATEVLESNDDDGVAKFLAREMSLR